VRLMRDGREITKTVRTDIPQENPKRDERFLDGYHPLDGATIVNMSPALGEEINVDPYLQGVMVLSLARRSARQLETLLIKSEDSDDWSMSIDRRGKIYDVPIRYLPRAN